MSNDYSRDGAEPNPEDSHMKTTAERHGELARSGLIRRVECNRGQKPFPLGVKRPGALKRFLEARD